MPDYLGGDQRKVKEEPKEDAVIRGSTLVLLSPFINYPPLVADCGYLGS